MNLEELKQHVRKATPHDWNGRQVFLRKLSAQDHLDLFGRAKNAETPPDPEADRRATVEFHINVIARSLADESCQLLITNDEGRRWLREDVDWDDLLALSELVLTHSGFRTEKKTS